VEEGDLGAEAGIALNSIRNAIMFVNDEVVCVDAIEGELLRKLFRPLFYLIIFLVFPVEAGSLRFGAGVKTDLAVDLNVQA
jgi:hypothetical protein